MQKEIQENKEHIQKIYTEKAQKLLKFCIVILIVNGITYLIGFFLYNSFDFGLVFEIITFIFILIANNRIEQKNMKLGKINTIMAIIPISFLIIYDLIHLAINIEEVLEEVLIYYTSSDQFFYNIEPYLFDITLIAVIKLLYKTYKALNKADNTQQSENYLDTFYDNL